MTTMVKYLTGKRVELVEVCAWCSRSNYPKLAKDQEYTHGLCGTHYRGLIVSLHKEKEVYL